MSIAIRMRHVQDLFHARASFDGVRMVAIDENMVQAACSSHAAKDHTAAAALQA